MNRFTEGIVTFENPAVSASLLPRPGTGIVILQGAVHAGAWHAPFDKEPLASVTASLLDEGTQKHTREEFRYRIERDGSHVDFWSEGRYLYFSVLSTAKHIDTAVELLFEALTEPTLSDASVRQVIEREAAECEHQSEDTRSEAGRAFSRLVFKEGSAAYEVSAKVERANTLSLTREDVLSFFKETYRGRIVVAAVGDIEAAHLEKLLNVPHWNRTPSASARPVQRESASTEPKKGFVSIPGKESVDVFMGAALPFLPTDPSFPALRIAVDLLGGGFSDHLTQTVRDRDGLTYGTYARIRGTRNGSGMYWSAWAMFGNSLYEKGMKALSREIRVFLEKGITEKNLAQKVEELEGKYAVVFSDMRGAAFELMNGLLSTGSASDIDRYISSITQLTHTDVQVAAERYLRIDAISASGAIDEKGNLL